MKKFFSFLMICTAMSVLAQAEEPIIIAAPDTTIDKTAYSLTEQGVTIAVSYGSAYPATHPWNNLGVTYFACLANGSITISADEPIQGIAINGWVKKNFSATCDKGNITYLSDSYDDTTGEPVLTISDIASTSVTINCNNQLRCFSVEIYFNENPDDPQDEGYIVDTMQITVVTAEALDYSMDTLYSEEGAYSYWLKLAPADVYPQVWLDLYAAVQGDLSGEYSLYNFNVGDYTYVQLSEEINDYEYAYDQEFTISKTGDNYHVEGWIIADNDIMYVFAYDGSIAFTNSGEQGIEDTQDGVKAAKVLRDGQIVIIRGEKKYNVLGTAL